MNITIASASEGFFGEETSTRTGSGFVIDREGHILTNDHVVENANTVQVTLFDGSSREAQVIGEDATNDAVVKIKPAKESRLPVTFGDSSKMVVGFNSTRAQTVEVLPTAVERNAPGEVVDVTFIRGGRAMDVKVKLGAS